MNRITNIRFFVVGIFFLCCACSKDKKSEPSLNYENERIDELKDLQDRTTAKFSYDAEKRLNRIDYSDNNGPITSLRLEYAPQSITAQFYKGAAPDPTREKYVFTLHNGKVVTTTMNRADGNRIDSYYEYDNADRLMEAGVRGIANNGSLFASLDVYFTYANQNEQQQLKLYGAFGSSATDSVSFTKTYDRTRQFISFANVGFNYFGSVTTGIDYKISGITDVNLPFPFFKHRQFVYYTSLTPAQNPLRKLTGHGKARDMLDFNNNGWKEVNYNGDYGESQFGYDDKGRLVKFLNYTLSWQ